MPVKDWSTTAASNVTVGGVSIAENCSPANLNDADRAIMADVRLRFDEIRSLKDAGAVGDGTTNDRPAIVAADAIGSFRVSAGSYLISTSITIVNDVVFAPGAKFVIPNGVTVTFSGQVSGPVGQIFQCTGTGAVVFSWTKTAIGHVEWWGGKADGATDNFAAWNAATTALLLVKMMGGDYLFSATPKITLQNRAAVGMGCRYNSGTNEVTRFIVSGGSADGLQVGPDAYPGSINAMPQGIGISDIYVTRSVAPVIGSNCVGVRVQYVLGAMLQRVKSQDSMKEFLFYGTVQTKAIDCQAARALAGTGVGTDYWRGFYADGTASIGAAGGNASLYLVRPNYGCNLAGLQTGDSIGLYVTSNFTDLFVEQPEGVTCRDDISIVGNGSTGADTGNADLRISHSTSDQFNRYGISVTNLGATGIVEIDAPYLGPASGATASLYINNCLGAVIVSRGEAIHYASTTCQAISVSGSKGVVIDGTGLIEVGSGATAAGLANINNCKINPLIKNAASTGAVAIGLSGTCTGNVIEPIIMGKANAFTKGIDVSGTADDRNEYRCTGIDSACLNGGSSKKLTRNSVAITATGLSGTNLVSGVMT